MHSEKEKMLAGKEYMSEDESLVKERELAHSLFFKYNSSRDSSFEIFSSHFGHCGESVHIERPFYCDYVYNLFLSDNVYMNFGCTILDCAEVHLETGVKLGPGVQIYTAGHPLDPDVRKSGLEFALPVRIGENSWIGGGSIILPGVTIGKNVVIGAGSVVTKDVPDDAVYAGNPARNIKKSDRH